MNQPFIILNLHSGLYARYPFGTAQVVQADEWRIQKRPREGKKKKNFFLMIPKHIWKREPWTCSVLELALQET